MCNQLQLLYENNAINEHKLRLLPPISAVKVKGQGQMSQLYSTHRIN